MGVQCYARALVALDPYVDAYVAETMSCVAESLQVLEAMEVARTVLTAGKNPETTNNKPTGCLLVSYAVDPEGDFRDGESLTEGIRRFLENLRETRKEVTVLAILFNCSEPEAITKALSKITDDEALVKDLTEHGIVLGAYAHTLTPVDSTWTLAES